MASLHFLFTNRAKFPFGSLPFFKSWAKRILLLPSLLKRNLKRQLLVSKGAKIDGRAELGKIRLDGRKSNLTIGSQSFLGRVTIALHDQVIIGNKVCINDGVEILTASHDVMDPEWKHVKAKIIIEDYAWIGTGAMILPGVTIGRGAVVGARAVVSRNVDPGAIVVGMPAVPIKKKRTENLTYDPCEFLAANRAWLIG